MDFHNRRMQRSIKLAKNVYATLNKLISNLERAAAELTYFGIMKMSGKFICSVQAKQFEQTWQTFLDKTIVRSQLV